MDIPSQRAMVQARLENLRRSQEAYSQGKLDAYSRRYASTMGIAGAGPTLSSIPASSSQTEEIPENTKPTIDRSKSLNIKDRMA